MARLDGETKTAAVGRRSLRTDAPGGRATSGALTGEPGVIADE